METKPATKTGKLQYFVQIRRYELSIIEVSGPLPKSPDSGGAILGFSGPYATRELAQAVLDRQLAHKGPSGRKQVK